LAIPTVSVHLGLSELQFKVRKELTEANVNNGKFGVLDQVQRSQELGAGVTETGTNFIS
jgi:hypothetical protein